MNLTLLSILITPSTRNLLSAIFNSRIYIARENTRYLFETKYYSKALLAMYPDMHGLPNFASHSPDCEL